MERSGHITETLTSMPNIGITLAKKLNKAGIMTRQELIHTGSENAFIRIATIEHDLCINVLYALEGAVRNIRWHSLDKSRKQELKEFYNMATKT